MLTEVMKHYGLASDLHAAGYYETDHHRQLCREVHAAILAGRLVAIAGMVGCGKIAPGGARSQSRRRSQKARCNGCCTVG